MEDLEFLEPHATCGFGGQQFSMETWKEYYKRMFLGVIELPNGNLMANPTHKLNTKECAEFMQKVEAHAVSEFGVVFEH